MNVEILLNWGFADDGSVVDFARTNDLLGEPIGSADTFIMDIQGGKGRFLGAEMNIGIRVGGFFNVSGTFAFQLIIESEVELSHASPLNIVNGEIEVPGLDEAIVPEDDSAIDSSAENDMLSLLTRVTVEGFTIGAGELNASVGIPGGPRLVLEDVAFTFVFLREKNAIVEELRRYWLALEAEAGRVELEGIPGIGLRGENLRVGINLQAFILVTEPSTQARIPVPIDGTTVDFEKSAELGNTFGTESTLVISMPGTPLGYVQALGYVTITAFDVIHIEAEHYFRRISRDRPP